MAENVATTVMGRNYCDNRAMSGYGGAWLYKEANESKFHMVVPVAELPDLEGSIETFEVNLLTCPTIGQVQGKATLEQSEISVLHHRDNARRLQALKGRTLDFMFLYKDGTAKRFSGKINYSAGSVGADVHNGRVTVTPLSAVDDVTLDARSMIKPTINFTSTIPESKTISTTSADNIIIVNTDPTRATLSATVIDGATMQTSTEFTASFGTGDDANKLTISRGSSSVGNHYGVVIITATDTVTIDATTGEKEYAEYSMSIKVDYTISST